MRVNARGPCGGCKGAWLQTTPRSHEPPPVMIKTSLSSARRTSPSSLFPLALLLGFASCGGDEQASGHNSGRGAGSLSAAGSVAGKEPTGLLEGMGQMASMFREAEVARAAKELEDEAEAASESDPDKAIALFVRMGPSLGEGGLTGPILAQQVESLKAAAEINATPTRLKRLAELQFKLGRFDDALVSFEAWRESLADGELGAEDLVGGCRAAACALMIRNEARCTDWKSWIGNSIEARKLAASSSRGQASSATSRAIQLMPPSLQPEEASRSGWNSGSPYSPYDGYVNSVPSSLGYLGATGYSEYSSHLGATGYAGSYSSGNSSARDAALQSQQDAMLRFQQQQAGRLGAMGVQIDW